MKKSNNAALLFATVLLCTTVTSCFDTADSTAKKINQLMPYFIQDPVEVIKSNIARNTDPAATDEELQKLTSGNMQFALDVYNAASENEGNIFFSPYSISIAMAMAYAGARGETGEEMANAMNFNLGQDRLHNAFNDLDLRLNADTGEGLTLNVANAAWCQKDFSFESAYLDLIAANYGSGVYLQDFMANPEGSRIKINGWVSDRTNNLIKVLIPEGVINTLTRLVLTNAIYFKAEWLSTFEPRDTKQDIFHGVYEDSQVDMMSKEFIFSYYDGAEFTAVELPYKGNKFSMLVVLPDEGKFSSVEDSLNAGVINEIISNLNEEQVRLKLPKFSFEMELGLKDILKGLGMNIAFEPWQADFSGITTAVDLFISNILHKAFVAVDEKGTEAAAATAVFFEDTCAPPPPIVMTIDRPFIFLILHKQTNTILFMGRVVNL